MALDDDEDEADLVRRGGQALVQYRLKKIEKAVEGLEATVTQQYGNLLEHTVSQSQLKDTVSLIDSRHSALGSEVADLKKRMDDQETKTENLANLKATRRSSWQIALAAASIGVLGPTLIGLVLFAVSSYESWVKVTGK